MLVPLSISHRNLCLRQIWSVMRLIFASPFIVQSIVEYLSPFKTIEREIGRGTEISWP